MTVLKRFMDDDRRGRWANVVMDNGDPCWISIAQSGVLVKKSRIGLFGAKLYQQENIYEAARTAQALAVRYPAILTPPGMTNPVLVAFTNAALNCRHVAEVAKVLNEASNREAEIAPEAKALLKAREIASKYGAVLEHSKAVVMSEAILPASVEEIKDALITLARHTKAAGVSDDAIEPLRVAYASLGGFVSDSEFQSFSAFDQLTTAHNVTQLGDDELLDFVGNLAETGPSAIDVQRRSSDKFARLVTEFNRRLIE